MCMKILLVDDDIQIISELEKKLKESGIQTDKCFNGEDALEYLSKNDVDLVLMDVDMPRLDGITTLREIKKTSNTPVFIMSERTLEMDVLFAYEAGCQDYIRKPFYAKEIIYKIKNFKNFNANTITKFDGLEIDRSARLIYIDGQKKELTQKTFELLIYLVKNKGMAVEREKLLNDVWGYGFFGDDRTIDTHIKMLRNSLGKYKRFIQTVRGFGYKFEVR